MDCSVVYWSFECQCVVELTVSIFAMAGKKWGLFLGREEDVTTGTGSDRQWSGCVAFIKNWNGRHPILV